MTDIKEVFGPTGAPEPSKKKRDVEPESFERMMKRVREVDPEEQRKRKHQQEAEEEQKAAQTIGQPTPQKETTSAIPKEDKFKIQLGEGTPSVRGEAPPTLGAQESATPSYAPEEEPPTEYPEVPFDYTSGWTQTIETTPTQPQPPAKQKKKEVEKAKETPPIAPPPKAPPIKKEGVLPPPTEKKAKAPPPVKPSIAPKLPKKAEKIPPSLPSPPPEEVKKKPKMQPEPTEVVVPPPPLPSGSWEVAAHAVEEKEKSEKIQAASTQIEQGMPLPMDTLMAPMPAITPETTAPYLHLPPQIMEMFERMAGVMTVMTSSGITQTTIVLDAPQFANSVFFGAEIVISEFSTAPKAFNIELLASPQGVNLANANMSELVAAFQAGQYNFKVNRIDTALLPVPAAKRRRVEKPKGRSST